MLVPGYKSQAAMVYNYDKRTNSRPVFSIVHLPRKNTFPLSLKMKTEIQYAIAAQFLRKKECVHRKNIKLFMVSNWKLNRCTIIIMFKHKASQSE